MQLCPYYKILVLVYRHPFHKLNRFALLIQSRSFFVLPHIVSAGNHVALFPSSKGPLHLDGVIRSVYICCGEFCSWLIPDMIIGFVVVIANVDQSQKL